jgi:uncharacterized protein
MRTEAPSPPMASVQIPSLSCLRCGYVWRPRRLEVRICPRCKSPRWESPRRRPDGPGTGLGVPEVLGPHRDRILELARNYHVRRLRVFGSVARAKATRRSDVDLIMERAPGWDGFDRMRLQEALERLLHRRVDLTTEAGLHPMVRPTALAEAVQL